MQTPKTRTGSLEVPQRTSPATTRTARQLKATGSDSESVSSPNPASRTPKDRSPKVVEHRSPRSPKSEKKRPGKVSELESQLAQLQEELKKAKDQLSSSEAVKKRAQQEADEAKKQLAAMSAKLEESQQQLMELSASEEARVQDLRKLSQERDRAWESELEALQKQHSLDSSALASSMNEIQKLKFQLERVVESDAAKSRHAESAHAEIQNLRSELSETLSVVENLKTHLSDCKESEARAFEVVNETQMQLKMSKKTEEMLRSEGLQAMEACKSLAVELEQSKARVNLLEEHVRNLQLQADLGNKIQGVQANEEHEDPGQLKAELNQVKSEVGHLRSALDATERRYHEEYIQSTLQIRSAYEMVEQTKSESSLREAELESKLKKVIAEIDDLKANIMAEETKLQNISEANEGLSERIEKKQLRERESEMGMEMELNKFEADLAGLKASLLDKENELKSIIDENEMLKLEIEKREVESNKVNDEALSLAEAARASEQEAQVKLGYLTEEADKSTRKAARVTEQLDAAQAANSEMEAELRRLKVQSDQWRKAAEAAAAMLSTGNNGKLVERTGSLDYHTIGGKLGSPFSEDMDDESPKKKNNNMLKKIGVLLKKGQK